MVNLSSETSMRVNLFKKSSVVVATPKSIRRKKSAPKVENFVIHLPLAWLRKDTADKITMVSGVMPCLLVELRGIASGLEKVLNLFSRDQNFPQCVAARQFPTAQEAAYGFGAAI